MHTFYNGLSDPTRTVIDASAGGALMKKTTYQAYGILEDMTTNSNQWPKDRVVARKAMGGADVDVLNNLATQVSFLTKQLQKQHRTVNATQTNPWEICKSYGGQHNTMECQSRHMTMEQAQYVARYNQQLQHGQYGGNSFQNQG